MPAETLGAEGRITRTVGGAAWGSNIIVLLGWLARIMVTPPEVIRVAVEAVEEGSVVKGGTEDSGA